MYVCKNLLIILIISLSIACTPPMMTSGGFDFAFLKSTPKAKLTKTFTLTDQDPNAVDMLFVIDNSSSMSGYQQTLANSFSNFIQQFSSSGIDFQIGVVTSSLSSSGTNGDGEYYAGVHANLYSTSTTCPTTILQTGAACNTNGFVMNYGHNNSGNLLIRGNALSSLPTGQHFFTKNTSNLNTLFTDVITGVGTSGNGSETVLKSAWTTLDSTKLATNAWNAGFIRPKAAFVLFLLTDEDEADNATTGGPYDNPIQTTCIATDTTTGACTKYTNTSQFTTRCLEKDLNDVCIKWNNEGPLTSMTPPAGSSERLPKIALDIKTRIESTKPNKRIYTRYLIDKSQLQSKITAANNIYPKFMNNSGGTPILLGISASESALLKGDIIDICEKDSANHCKDYGQQLIDSAKSIISSIQGVYQLEYQPVTAIMGENFKVYINDVLVPQDNVNGWTYVNEGFSIILHGTYAPPNISGTMKIEYEAYKP